MKTILKLVVFVGFCWFLGSLFSDDKDDTTTTETSNSTPSNWKTCPIHNKTYTEGNAYDGCPECAKERDFKNAERARKKINGY